MSAPADSGVPGGLPAELPCTLDTSDADDLERWLEAHRRLDLQMRQRLAGDEQNGEAPHESL